MSRDNASLLDIFQAGQRVLQFSQGLSREELHRDVMRLSAILYQLEIVGEATKRLSGEFRDAHPDVDFQIIDAWDMNFPRLETTRSQPQLGRFKCLV